MKTARLRSMLEVGQHCPTCCCHGTSYPIERGFEEDIAVSVKLIDDQPQANRPSIGDPLAGTTSTNITQQQNLAQVESNTSTFGGLSPAVQTSVYAGESTGEKACVDEEGVNEEGGHAIHTEDLYDQILHNDVPNKQLVAGETILLRQEEFTRQEEHAQMEYPVSWDWNCFQDDAVQLIDPILDDDMHAQLLLAGVTSDDLKNSEYSYFYGEHSGSLSQSSTVNWGEVAGASQDIDFDAAQALFDFSSQPILMPSPSSPHILETHSQLRAVHPDDPSATPYGHLQGPRKIKPLPRNPNFPGRMPPIVSEEEALGFNEELKQQIYIAKFSAPPEFTYREFDTTQLTADPLQPEEELSFDVDTFADDLADQLSFISKEDRNAAHDPFCGERRRARKPDSKARARHQRH